MYLLFIYADLNPDMLTFFEADLLTDTGFITSEKSVSRSKHYKAGVHYSEEPTTEEDKKQLFEDYVKVKDFDDWNPPAKVNFFTLTLSLKYPNLSIYMNANPNPNSNILANEVAE